MISRQQALVFFKKYGWVVAACVLLVVATTLCAIFQSVPSFPDPDSFYHAKMAQIIRSDGIIKTFPWLQVSVIRDHYIDQHFLYHVFLVPFEMALGPLWGAKFANVVLTSLLVMVFYFMLRRYHVRFAFVYSLILLVTMPFMFRVNLVKAPAFSILFLLIGLHVIFQYRYRALFLLSFFYVWAYGGFILIVIFAGIYAFVGIAYDWVRNLQHRTFFSIIGHSRDVKLFFASLAGVIAGIIVNPYFPHNLSFYWNQLIKIGIINYQKVISVGNEWYPYKFVDLTAGTALVTVLLVVAFVLMVVNRHRLSKKVLTLFGIFLLLLVFTLKSRRYVEYYVPFAILFEAFAIHQLVGQYAWRAIGRNIVSWYSRYRVIATILIVYFAVMVPALAAKDIRGTYRDYQGGIPLTRFQKAATWLKENTQKGEIVFHSSWDEFPILFYFNSQNYYIAGLDPTFTYEYSHDLYRRMVDITIGTQTENLHDDIRGKFGASYVFVESNHRGMEQAIENDGGFAEAYRDAEATIYRVLD
ncbi:MAG: hypothetical protein PHY34_00130 [Patescibacteria group bacterium]|nr:hypothetical protein [Patescibacteria group bacterium]MDD5715961.1 hypothetical protein [Patescibacteria group bacterium]